MRFDELTFRQQQRIVDAVANGIATFHKRPSFVHGVTRAEREAIVRYVVDAYDSIIASDENLTHYEQGISDALDGRVTKVAM